MPEHERPYQWSFDFGRKEEPSIYYELGFAGHESQEDTGRFVRKLKEEVQIRSPNDAATHLLTHVFTPFEAFDQEELWTLLLNTKNLITHEVMIYRGTVDTVYIRPAELFKEAVRVNAPALLLAHIHPSGITEPSPQDIRVTQDAHQAGQLLGINVLDHIIIGNGVWTSLREQKLGFE
jgi:DNA repair protein RadC